MSTQVAKITAKLEADIRNFEQKMGRADKSLGKLDKSGKGVDKTFGKMAKAAVAFGAAMLAGKFTQGVGKAISVASDLVESVNAVEVSMGDASAAVFKLGDTAAKSLGLSKLAVNEAAVAFAAFGEKIAVDGNVGAVFEKFITRATDFASVMNLDVSDALLKFQSGLAGEAESLRRFGIDVSATTIELFAYENGIAKVGEKLTEAQKIQARFGSIMEQTTKFAGDFANTSGDLAGQQRILNAEWEDAQAILGKKLIPALNALVGVGIKVVSSTADVITNTERGVSAFTKLFGLFTDFGADDRFFDAWSDADEALLQFTKTQAFVTGELGRGVDATRVAGSWLIDLAQKGAITAKTFDKMRATVGLTNEEFAEVAAKVADAGNRFGITAEQVQTLRNQFAGWDVLLTPIERAAASAEQHLADMGDAAEEAAKQTADAAEEAAESFKEWEQEIAEAAAGAEQALRGSMRGIIDLFSAAPDKIKISVDEMIANIRGQRVMAEEFEKNMRVLMAAGLDALVNVLRESGPAAVDQAAALASDINSAFALEIDLRAIAGDKVDDLIAGSAVLNERLTQMGMTAGQAYAAGFNLTSLSIAALPPGVTRGSIRPVTVGGNTLLHSGGVVPGPRGADVPIIAQAGETIIPLGGTQPTGATVFNINVAGSVITEKDLVVAVRDGLIELERRNGTHGL